MHIQGNRYNLSAPSHLTIPPHSARHVSMPSSNASRAPALVDDSNGEPVNYDYDRFNDAALNDDPHTPPCLSKSHSKGKQKKAKS